MPTARELLEEVDALMRRNRPSQDGLAVVAPDAASDRLEQGEGTAHHAPLADGLPEATHETFEHGALSSAELDDIPVLTDVAQDDQVAIEPKGDDATPEPSFDDFPVLTDAVDLGAPAAFVEPIAPDDELSIASEEDEALIGGLPAEAFGIVAASIAAHASAKPEEQSRLAQDDPRWATLAEEIRMQVLQRVDLFTESGLHDRLQSHLKPIVDRASAELVATINEQLGRVLRAYVAEAIEREIEKWRHDSR